MTTPARPGPLEPVPPEVLRQARERDAWLGDPNNLEAYSGQVVAVHQGRVWGHGPDHAAAIETAEAALSARAGEPDLPPYEALTFIAVPDCFAEEPLPDY
jgi:hypothetical protein